MILALYQKFHFILDRNLAKANCTGNRFCTSCDIVVLALSLNMLGDVIFLGVNLRADSVRLNFCVQSIQRLQLYQFSISTHLRISGPALTLLWSYFVNELFYEFLPSHYEENIKLFQFRVYTTEIYIGRHFLMLSKTKIRSFLSFIFNVNTQLPVLHRITGIIALFEYLRPFAIKSIGPDVSKATRWGWPSGRKYILCHCLYSSWLFG